MGKYGQYYGSIACSRSFCSDGLSEIWSNRKDGVPLNPEIKRVYEEPGRGDGVRILVDRLWPRGLTKEKAQVDLWLKDIAPSTELRKWYSHDPSKWAEFQARYRKELKSKADLINILKQKEAKGPITLLYGARDEAHNEAVVLQSLLQSR